MKTISQCIIEIRIRPAMKLLQQGTMTASEVACKVGFGSTPSFNNCFRGFFGYSPWEVKKRSTLRPETEDDSLFEEKSIPAD